METEQRTEKRARCEIIPASAQVKHSHQKYALKNHGKFMAEENKIGKKPAKK